MLYRGEKTLGEDRAVVGELVAAGLRELLKKIGHGQLLLLLARNVEDDVAVVQHDEAVAVLNGIAHVVRDHQRGELALAHDAVGELHDLGGGLRVECRGVLIEQQQLGALERCHQQRERLALAAGERRDLRGQAGLKAEAETAEQLAVLLLFLLRHAPGKTAALAAAGIESFILQGDTPLKERAELVRRFNDGEAPVFLISLKAGGTGLNLTGADTVIHYDPWWNLAAQNQASDRCYRIGQTRKVQVYRLIAKDTIEENILKLQEKKSLLAELAAGDTNGGLLAMSREDLMELLE